MWYFHHLYVKNNKLPDHCHSFCRLISIFLFNIFIRHIKYSYGGCVCNSAKLPLSSKKCVCNSNMNGQGFVGSNICNNKIVTMHPFDLKYARIRRVLETIARNYLVSGKMFQYFKTHWVMYYQWIFIIRNKYVTQTSIWTHLLL